MVGATLLSKGAQDVFDEATRHPNWYRHGYDTWDNVTHTKYNEATGSLLEGYIKEKGGKLSKPDAEKFTQMIASGDFKDLSPSMKKKFATEISDISKWRGGFLRSMTVVETFRTFDDKLSPEELKSIARYMDGQDVPLSPRAQKAVKSFMKLPKAKRTGLLGKASKVVGVIAIGAFLYDVPSTYADGGAEAVVLRAAADLAMKDVVEAGVNSAGGLIWKNILGIEGVTPIHNRLFRKYGISPYGEPQ